MHWNLQRKGLSEKLGAITPSSAGAAPPVEQVDSAGERHGIVSREPEVVQLRRRKPVPRELHPRWNRLIAQENGMVSSAVSQKSFSSAAANLSSPLLRSILERQSEWLSRSSIFARKIDIRIGKGSKN
jgi:hypothetical protein